MTRFSASSPRSAEGPSIEALPFVVSGHGVWLVDYNGRQFLDACGSRGVVTIGHGQEMVTTGVKEQMSAISYISPYQSTNSVSERLAQRLCPYVEKTLPDPWFLFTTSATTALEWALQLARLHWLSRGKDKKHVVITTKPSYFGSSFAAMALSASHSLRSTFKPYLFDSPAIPLVGIDDPLSAQEKALQALEDLILEYGHEHVAAFVVEPIGGVSSAALQHDIDYWSHVRKICDRYDVLLIVDERITGVGRTGHWLACEHYALHPDMLILGQGLASGYVPLAAVVTGWSLIDELKQPFVSSLQLPNFANAPVICQAGISVLDILEQHQLVDQSAMMGLTLFEKLHQRLQHCPSVGHIRGKGLWVGLEFFQDTGQKIPFAREKRFTQAIWQSAMEAGLMVWPHSGSALHDDRGDRILLAPPYVIQEREIDWMVETLANAIESAELLILSS